MSGAVENSPRHSDLDKKFLISVLLALTINLVGITWWAATVHRDLDHLRTEMKKVYERNARYDEEVRKIRESVVRIETRLNGSKGH